MDPNDPRNLYQQVADALAEGIASGAIKGRLPGEGRLAAEYGVARETVRAALALLRERGLIVTVPGRGSFVAPPGATPDTTPADTV